MKEYLEKIKEEFNKSLENKLMENKSNEILDDMLKYSCLLGGKRIRPIILYMLADIFKKDYTYIVNEAISIELVHTYSLIHDDLPCMDNDDYRRGNLTLHKKFGEANALLTGDALLTMAFLVLSQSDYSNKNSIITLSYYIGNKGMILGQYLDIYSENKYISFEDLLEIHINKTAKLLMCCIELASISLKIDNFTRNKLRRYMFYIGLAYQVQDDILEIEGSFEKIGKLNSDSRNNKNTFVSILGLEKSKEILNYFINEAIESIKEFDLLVNFAKYILNRES